MKAEIISVGTELLLGKILDTDSQFLSLSLSNLGIDLFFRQTVGDNPKRLKEAIKIASKRSDIIITVGGLGPTVDDITLKGISELFKLKLVKNEYILKQLKRYFGIRGLKMPQDNLRQAFIPKGSLIFKNDNGTAPGIYTKVKNKHLLLLPGPPSELIPMFRRYIYVYFKRHFSKNYQISSKVINLAGIPESMVNEKVVDLLSLKGPLTVGIYASPSGIRLAITAKSASEKKINTLIKPIKKIIYSRLNEYIFGEDEEMLEGSVGKLLAEKHLTLSIAESATGGFLSNRITNVPGSSRYFLASFIVYSNASKTKLLNIKKEILLKFGAVSRETASYMAKKTRYISGSDISISITGIAGPSGAASGKPIGTHYIALFDGKNLIVKKFILSGERELIKLKASQEALIILWKYLKN